VHWRRDEADDWRTGNAVRFLKDKSGSVEIRDERNEKVTLPNDSRFVKERTK